VLASVCCVLVRWLLEFVALCAQSRELKELEIIVLRHELAILRRRAPRPPITAVERMFVAAASRLLSHARWRFLIVTPRRWRLTSTSRLRT
jgi:putative transposase